MFVPQSYALALAMLAVSMVCWGSWANTTKLARGYRFELFYWDYIFGIVVAALVYGHTLGSQGAAGVRFVDDIHSASSGNLALALLSGIIFNVANLLLVAAIEIAGLAVAFPVGIGLALVIGATGNYLVNPIGNALLLFAGVALVSAAIVVDALAYRSLTAGQAKQAAAAAGGGSAPAGSQPAPASTTTGLLLSIACGILMGLFYPFYARASYTATNPAGVGPYGGFFVFALGTLLCTIPLNGLYFMRKPIRGEAVAFGDYFRVPFRWHVLGWLGGLIWGTGGLFNFVASAAGNYGGATAGPAVSYALGQGATMVSAVWGVFVWKEFRGADARTRQLLALMFVFFLAGLALVAVAPLK